MNPEIKFADEQSKFVFDCVKKWAGGNKDEHILKLSLDSYEKITGKRLETVIKNCDGKKIVLFGNGAIADRICRMFALCNLPLHYYTTNNPSYEKKYNSLPYISIDEIRNNIIDLCFIIATSIPTYIHEIKEQLSELGANRESIIFSCDDMGNQYFDLKELELNNNEVFVDAGSFNGDDVRKFIRATNGVYDKIFSFEPDKVNFKNCRDTIGFFQNTVVENAGLWSKTQSISFFNQSTGSSCIDETTESSIEVYALDEYLESKRVTYIKMDIEGAELQALKGAKNTIVKHRPKLAICVYHKPEDIYEIPEYILRIAPFYKLYLRHYSIGELETVLYAIPSKESEKLL